MLVNYFSENNTSFLIEAGLMPTQTFSNDEQKLQNASFLKSMVIEEDDDSNENDKNENQLNSLDQNQSEKYMFFHFRLI